MEYAEGGELFDQVQEDLAKEALDESVAKFQFYQICTTIAYLHRFIIEPIFSLYYLVNHVSNFQEECLSQRSET